MIAAENEPAATAVVGQALLISPVCPDPLGNGLARRAWSWAAALAGEHHLVTAVVDAWSQASTIPAGLPGKVLIFPRGDAPPGDPRQEQVWPAADFAAVLQQTFACKAPSRLIVFRVYMDGAASLLPEDWRAIAEIDWDDRESATRRSLACLALRRGRLREALAHWRDGAACEDAERRALATYRKVHLASPEDAAVLRRRRATVQVGVHPNRIAGPLRPPLAPLPGTATILFVGTLGYLPNEDAVLWLAEDIAPRLRRLVPQVRIAVVGAAPDWLAARMRAAGLDHLGPLVDLTAAYASASLAVAPLRGGGGTKIKVLEAWQHGRAVVATSHACRGLPVSDGHHVLRADTASGIAAACARILHNPALGSRLALAGQALLRENFLLPSLPDRGTTMLPMPCPTMRHDRIHASFRHGPVSVVGAELDRERLLTILAETQEHLSQAKGEIAEAQARAAHLQNTLDSMAGHPVWRVARRLFDMIEQRPGLHRLLRRVRRAPSAPPLSADAALLLASPFFDPAWYAARQPGLPADDAALAAHCERQRGPGQPAPGPGFDPAWYIARNPDAAAGNALLHYLKTGQYRLRPPTAAAEREAEAARRATLGLDLVVAPLRIAIGLVGPGGGQGARAARSARIAAAEAGLGDACEILWAGDAAMAPEGTHAIAVAGSPGAAMAHNMLLRAAAHSGAVLYFAVDARGIFDPGSLASLVRMSAAADHGALIAAQDFPQENPKAFDPITFETGWAGGGCLLVPVAVAQALGGFDPALDCLSQADLSWRARQHGHGVKLCPRALFHSPRHRRDGTRWIDSAELAEACCLASLWGHHAAAVAMGAQLRLHGGEVPDPGPDRHGRDPCFADFTHGAGLAPARW